MTQKRQGSKGTHAVIAIFIGLLIAGSLRSFGSPQQGFGDEVIMGMFSIAVLVFIGFGLWFAISSLAHFGGGGSGGSGGGGSGGGSGGTASGSPIDLTPVINAVNSGFGGMATRLDDIHKDTQHIRGVVDGLKGAVDGLVKMMKKWMPALGRMLQTVQAALRPIGLGVAEVQKVMGELKSWKDKDWPAFTSTITAHMADVAQKAQAAEGEFKHLKDEVGKLEVAQVQTTAAVAELKKEQGALVQAVNTGFGAVPAAVATQVQAGLTAMEGKLMGELGKVTASQAGMDALLKRFDAEFKDFDRRVSADVRAVAPAVVGQVGAAVKDARDLVLREVARLAQDVDQQQVSLENAMARLTDVQLRTRERLEKAIAGVPQAVRVVVEREADGIISIFKDNIAELSRAQSQTSAAVQGLSVESQRAKDLILARMQHNQDKVREELARQLAAIQKMIEDEVDPLARELQALNSKGSDLIKAVTEQGSVLNQLSASERAHFEEVSRQFVLVQDLLDKLDRESAKQDVLVNVEKGVSSIVTWVGTHGGKLDEILGRFPELNAKLDELKRLVELLQQKQKRVRDGTNKAVNRQKDVVTGIKFTQHRFNNSQFDVQALVFLTNLVRIRQQLDNEKVELMALKVLMRDLSVPFDAARKQLCVVADSSLAQITDLRANLPVMGFPPNLLDEEALLGALCPDDGRLMKKITGLIAAAGLVSSTKKRVVELLDEVIKDKLWSEVAGKLADDLKATYRRHTSGP